MRATPGNHTHKALPEQRARLEFERTLNDIQYRALIQGIIPRSPEDRWFAFEVDDWFTLCRSATGNCIFRVKLEENGGGWQVSEAWANRHPDQYASAGDAADAQMLNHLLDGIIRDNMT